MIETKKRTFAWFSVGLLIALLALLVVSGGLAGKVLVTDPEGISETADAVLNSLHTGDWKTLEQLVAGNPPLTPETGKDGSAENQIWNAYQHSLQWVCADSYGVAGACVTQRVTVSCLDISAVTGTMAQLLQESAASPDNRDASLRAAAEQALNSGAPTIERQLTLTFVRQNGQWQVLPDSALLSLLSGFTSNGKA